MNPALKKVLGLAFTIEEDKTETNQPVVLKTANQNSNFETRVEQTTSFTQPSTGYHPLQGASLEDTQKYKEHFLKLLKESNLPGNDYYELNMNLDAMVNSIPDERTRFIAAFTPLSIQGLTKEKVESSAKAYLSTLDQDAISFNQALERQSSESVDGQKKQIESNNKRITELSAEIERLTRENVTIGQSVSSSESKLNSSRNGYLKELTNIKNKINSDLVKFRQYFN